MKNLVKSNDHDGRFEKEGKIIVMGRTQKNANRW